MRQFREKQLPLQPIWGSHQHSRELRMIARVLDENPEIEERVHADLLEGRSSRTGRSGLSGEQVLRIALLKQIHGLSYRELEFHLQDSDAFRSFTRLSFRERPSHGTLQENVVRIQPATWEFIHRIVIGVARDHGIERGEKIRGDTTVVNAAIHEPSDSSLLWDCVRVSTRILHRIARRKPRLRKHFSDHTRRAKRRAYALKFHRRDKDPKRQYRDLIGVAEVVARDARCMIEAGRREKELEPLIQELAELLSLMDRIVDQTRRRVLKEEKVPSSEKLVSIFEPHTDIIVKDNRQTLYGHKVCLVGGKSSLILDCVVEQGNPADATLVERTIQRHIDLFGVAPRQAAFDGAFGSKQNIHTAKELGVEDIAFNLKRGLEMSEMVRSAWVFRRLRDFRSGIEGCISTLKRAFQMDRCTWRGFEAFRCYVWNCVTSFNLVVLARHLLAAESG